MTQSQHWEWTINEWIEPKMMTYLEKAFLSYPIKVVYDIGACVGGWSAVVEAKFKPEKIYCFEPDLDNFKWLTEHLPNVAAFPYGIYYGKDSAKALSVSPNCGSQFIENDRHPEAKDTGKVFNLKELESFDIDKPDFVKIDIEGAERNVMAASSIMKNAPVILVEWHYTKHKYDDEADVFFSKELPNHQIIYKDHPEGNMFLLKIK